MKTCPKCGHQIVKPPKAGTKAWAYTPTNDSNKNEALKKAEVRQRIELGYGIPETKRRKDVH
jgi:hypothetical protein